MISFCFICALISSCLFAYASEKDDIKSINNSIVRFHIRANSDDEYDQDIFKEEDIISYVMDSDTDAKYDIYTISCSEGSYSFRATDTENKSLGGGVIKVPAEEIVDNNEQETCDTAVYLRLSKTYITNKYKITN